MNNSNNNILKGVSLNVDFEKLTPEQKQEILAYIKFVKNKEESKNNKK